MDRISHHVRSYSVNRRRALQLGATGIGLAALSSRSVAAQSEATPVASDIPVTGESVAELGAFDAVMAGVMSRWQIPGGQLAIAVEGRLVYNRGFGYASIEDQEEVQPHSLFRIASNTKPITAVAILKLVDAGELTLDTQVFPLLALDPPEGAPRDPRLDTITIEQLLVHSGGWIGTAEDLVRFSLAVDGARGKTLLAPETVTAMESTPRPPSAAAGAGSR